MKTKALKFVAKDWVKAYEESVQKKTKYLDYRIKESSIKMFEKLSEKYPGISPYLFMEANFPPYKEWWIPNKRKTGFKRLPFPFPNMLFGVKAEEAYKKHLRKGIKSVKSREESILQEVQDTVERLQVLQVDFTDYEEIWNLYGDDLVSIFFLIELEGFLPWLAAQTRKKKIDFICYTDLIKKKGIILEFTGLKKKIGDVIERVRCLM